MIRSGLRILSDQKEQVAAGCTRPVPQVTSGHILHNKRGRGETPVALHRSGNSSIKTTERLNQYSGRRFPIVRMFQEGSRTFIVSQRILSWFKR
jgi:hypothetical protein